MQHHGFLHNLITLYNVPCIASFPRFWYNVSLLGAINDPITRNLMLQRSDKGDSKSRDRPDLALCRRTASARP